MEGSGRPLIAVTTSEIRPGHPIRITPQGEPPQAEMALGLKYLKAIESAGGIPVVIPPLATVVVEQLLDRVDGLCLSGGPDLDPLVYGASQHRELGPTWHELDRFELALMRAADAREMPILAICRGLQLVNVARGGRLHQHLPEIVGPGINHRQQEPGSWATHPISLTGTGRLPEILGTVATSVNSFHHQAVDELGEGLMATGYAPDGTVESLEAQDRNFLLGVQWHAECLVDRPEQLALFQALVGAGGRYSAGRSQTTAAV
jgi:putative glutamine amidotransferase